MDLWIDSVYGGNLREVTPEFCVHLLHAGVVYDEKEEVRGLLKQV
jgi:hypothetical protein